MAAELNLLPCPFCQGTDLHTHSNGYQSHMVVCGTCGAEGPAAVDDNAAVEAWNRRAVPSANASEALPPLPEPEELDGIHGILRVYLPNDVASIQREAYAAGRAAIAEDRAQQDEPVNERAAFEEWWAGWGDRSVGIVEYSLKREAAMFAWKARGKLATKAAAPADARVYDLAALVRRLVRALKKANPNSELPEQALDYLQRKGLTGSILRAPAEDAREQHPMSWRDFDTDAVREALAVYIQNHGKTGEASARFEVLEIIKELVRCRADEGAREQQSAGGDQ